MGALELPFVRRASTSGAVLLAAVGDGVLRLLARDRAAGAAA